MFRGHHTALCCLFLLIARISLPALAQPDSIIVRPLQEIVLQDGSEIIGYIESEDEATIHFTTLSNIQMTIPRIQIRSIRPATGRVVDGEYLHPDPNASRLLLAPTARAIKSGSGYFADYMIFFPMLAFGIADVVSFAGGMSLFPGIDQQLIYLAPKVTPLHLKNFDVAAGFLHISIPSEEPVGVVYTMGTYGSPDRALTFGLGWGFSQGDLNNESIVVIGGEIRVSRYIKLISENWFPPASEVQILAGGIRFFGQRLAADFSFIYPAGAEMEGFPFIPWVGFVYNFGN